MASHHAHSPSDVGCGDRSGRHVGGAVRQCELAVAEVFGPAENPAALVLGGRVVVELFIRGHREPHGALVGVLGGDITGVFAAQCRPVAGGVSSIGQ
ncbi:hypothetical protein RHRU231_620025 [Rhodococcus ruber]|uniref:Uncharacterized protein n=1 Tax=Rhodococcus ruber TaxID=1830 RepID=A0A098BN40_9NOCA|nr:hypothetical protein RHRU231_620025 [Rhodococcus ruber]